MNSRDTWQTKEQVMKDLARVSHVGHLTEANLVVGNAPPPLIEYEVEDDMLSMLGFDNMTIGDIPDNNMGPDLVGITSLLRMVQESDQSDNQSSKKIVSIRKPTLKLNPYVKDFVPKTDKSSQSNSHDNLLEKTDTNIDNPGDCNNNVDKIKDELRNKISEGNKADCYEKRKERNVAIATLLSLNAANSKTKNTSSTEPLKLVTPDFYSKEEDNATTRDSVKSKTTLNTPVHISLNASISNIASDTGLNTVAGVTETKSDPAIKESIDKVNNWFNRPIREPTAISLEPIVFKRKVLPQASDSNGSVEQVDCPSVKALEFKPSEYATALSQKYMERAQHKQTKKLNSWTDLDVILKEREKNMATKESKKSKKLHCNPTLS